MNSNDKNNSVSDEIMLTHDVLARYRISRSTLYFWSTPARMPASFKRPFPLPAIAGSPKRWRRKDVMKWEDEVNAVIIADTQLSQDAQPTPPATDADQEDNHEGYIAP